MNALNCYGVSCRHNGDHDIPRGSLCYIMWIDRNNGSRSVNVWTTCRKGFAISKIVNLTQLHGFKAVWMPMYAREWKGVANTELSGKLSAQRAVEHLTAMISAYSTPAT